MLLAPACVQANTQRYLLSEWDVAQLMNRLLPTLKQCMWTHSDSPDTTHGCGCVSYDPVDKEQIRCAVGIKLLQTQHAFNQSIVACCGSSRSRSPAARCC